MSSQISTIQQVFSKISASYSLFLIISAVIFNPLVLFVCIKSKKLRSTNTFKLLAFSSINDLLCCLGWNQEDFSSNILNYSTSFLNLEFCRWVSVFIQYSTLQYASWMLVSISLDRLLGMTFKKWSNVYFTGSRPVIYASLLAVCILGLNFNEVLFSGYILNDNGTEIVICYQTDPSYFNFHDLMSQILLYFGAIVPYAFLVVINSLIIYKATRFSRAQKASTQSALPSNTIRGAKRKAQMTRMIIIITFLYIALSLPGSIVAGYFFEEIYYLEAGPLIINLLNNIQFSYPALSFFILFFSNKLFAEEFKQMFSSFKKSSVSVLNRTNNI